MTTIGSKGLSLFFKLFHLSRLSAPNLNDVDRKDTHVRLQEIFRDQRNALDKTLREVELHYEHILQVNNYLVVL